MLGVVAGVHFHHVTCKKACDLVVDRGFLGVVVGLSEPADCAGAVAPVEVAGKRVVALVMLGLNEEIDCGADVLFAVQCECKLLFCGEFVAPPDASGGRESADSSL